jgi:hypothetical protein
VRKKEQHPVEPVMRRSAMLHVRPTFRFGYIRVTSNFKSIFGLFAPPILEHCSGACTLPFKPRIEPGVDDLLVLSEQLFGVRFDAHFWFPLK